MDEFLVAPHPAEARLWIVASRADRHLRMRDHEGTALEVPRLHGETEEPEHRGRDVELRGRIGAHSGPYQGARGIMQQQRDSQRLLVRHVVVGAPAVLAESLAVVGDDDKESVPVQSRCLVLIEERPQKEVVSPKGVEITIQLRIVRIPLWSMPGQQCAPIVRVYGEVRGKKRLRALLRFEPSAGRRQHRIVLVAEIVGLLEPFVAEARGADEVVIPHREDHERAVLDAFRTHSPCCTTWRGLLCSAWLRFCSAWAGSVFPRPAASY